MLPYSIPVTSCMWRVPTSMYPCVWKFHTKICYLPFTLPIAMRNIVQRWIHTVYMERDVTVITENQSPFIIALPTALTHRAVQASPSLLKYNLRYLQSMIYTTADIQCLLSASTPLQKHALEKWRSLWKQRFSQQHNLQETMKFNQLLRTCGELSWGLPAVYNTERQPHIPCKCNCRVAGRSTTELNRSCYICLI